MKKCDNHYTTGHFMGWNIMSCPESWIYQKTNCFKCGDKIKDVFVVSNDKFYCCKCLKIVVSKGI